MSMKIVEKIGVLGVVWGIVLANHQHPTQKFQNK